MTKRLSTLMLIALFFVACATTPQGRYIQVARVWNDAVKTWNDSVQEDNAQVRACLERGEVECQPVIPQEVRDKAVAIIEEGNKWLDEAGGMLDDPEASSSQINFLLEKVQALALRLSIHYLSESN